MGILSRRFDVSSVRWIFAATIAVAAAVTAGAATPLLRFPDVSGDAVVFTYAEDIWTASIAGGPALRLTDHEGEERHPKFSPDGGLIAFTADIDGNPDVFVMSADGSDIRRLTYHPSGDEVVGWHPTKAKVMFRSNRASFSRFDRLFLIAPDGTGLEELPLHEAGRGSFSADGTKIAYNRIAREDRTWKRYFGGMAQDLWVYDLASRQDRRLTDYRGTDRLPMWIGETIYFASDRDGPLNIYAFELADGAIRQVTHHTDFDVRRPSHGGDRIVYEVGGRLWLLDTASGDNRQIPIEITTEPREARPYLHDVSDFVTEVQISNEGGRALVVARGEIFTVPREHGATRNITRSSGTRERGAMWSPDGSKIAFFSDRTGEYQMYVGDTLGVDQPRQITNRDRGYPHTLRWSPDGSKIAYTDQTLTLYVVDVASSKVTKVDKAPVEPMDVSLEAKPISDHSWSPDSRWLAYSKIGNDYVSNIYLWSLASGTAHNVSSGLFNDFGPVFSADGRHLLFISNRRFDPTYGDFEWEMVYKRMAGIYALSLAADGEPLLPPRSDESAAVPVSQKEAEPGTPEVIVALEGLTDRIEALPLDRGNYRKLAAGTDRLYYLNVDHGDFNAFEFRSRPAMDLISFSLEDREEETLVEAVDSFALSADRKHLVFRKDDTIGIWDTKSEHQPDSLNGPKEKNSFEKQPYTLDLSGLEMRIDPKAEWNQVYWESWRLERDHFYDANLHGLDWQAVGDAYGSLLPGVSCAQDLRFLIGELIGELATSHTYVRTGDRRRRAERVNVGMLGADWVADEGAGRYRIAKLFTVPHWSRDVIPPLVGPGKDVRTGDYLIAVDGENVTTDRSIYAHFQGLAGKHVHLEFSGSADGSNSRKVVVEPLSTERTLRYLDWVEHNRRVVDEASGGRIGYLHFPDTYLGTSIEFPAYYYSQTTKEGLLVDGRFNGGGLDPDIFLNRMAKKPLAYWTRRYSADQVTPVYVSRAHMALLTNRQAGSGGDELPNEFRQKGMGPVIGTRTWGGLVGVSMFIRLMNGAGLTVPDYRIYTPEGQWTVENEGVSPDIEVELDPAEMADGVDAQLKKGIEVLLAAIEQDPRAQPEHPPFPVLN